MMKTMRSEDVAAMSYQEVGSILQTNPQVGLTSQEAEHRRKIYGHNDFDISEDDPLWKKYLGQVKIFFVSYVGTFTQNLKIL